MPFLLVRDGNADNDGCDDDNFKKENISKEICVVVRKWQMQLENESWWLLVKRGQDGRMGPNWKRNSVQWTVKQFR